MRIKSIVIKNYKAIQGPLIIDFVKNPLMPIIGVNECGKTTILNAIFAFDVFNDDYDKSIKHLTDTSNLYSTKSRSAKISALVEIDAKTIVDYLKKIRGKGARIPRQKINEINIERTIDGVKNFYSCKDLDFKFKDEQENHDFCKDIVAHLPYILYFDDFKDSFPEKVALDKSVPDQWQDVLKQLFKKTDKDLSLYDLASMEERKRKSTLSKVQKHLNNTLTSQWSNFKLDQKDALEISIEFTADGEKKYLKFDVIEKDDEGNEHFFYVKDRSKGFYWFFNFVMKLEFNPKINGSDNNAIYLLDEPGCYLHPFAQQKLCSKLKEISQSNKVIYCTHTHYLLDPNVIPLNTIRIADKNSGSVTLFSYHDYPFKRTKSITAFQPIYDALQLQPLPLELKAKRSVLVEGIYDYYSFTMFKPKKYEDVNIIPCRGADSIINFISLMIGFNISYKALWDNDEEGRKMKLSAGNFFGDEEAKSNFKLLPSPKRDRLTQDLYDGEDINLIKNELLLPKNSKYNRIVSALFFSPDKMHIIEKISDKTKNNFGEVFFNLYE